MAEINWTRESEIWLPRERLQRFTKRLSCSDHPQIGHRCEPEQSREVRILLHEHYRITYLIKPDGDIDILGVFHGALDIDRYFI